MWDWLRCWRTISTTSEQNLNPKITLLLDHGYHPVHLTQQLEKVYPQVMKKIKFELSTKPSKQRRQLKESLDLYRYCSLGDESVLMLDGAL